MVVGTKTKGSFKVDNCVEAYDPEFQKESLNGPQIKRSPEAGTEVRV